jgi:hypothetical protein
MKAEVELELLLKLLNGVIFIRTRCKKRFQCHITRRDTAANPLSLEELAEAQGQAFYLLAWEGRQG